jgi:thioredoxin reductase (NADPH)
MNNTYDVVIIGSGAAGLSAGIYASRFGRKTLILEDNGAGGQALNIESLENYPGVFTAISGAEFASRLKAQAESFGVEFLEKTCTAISTGGGGDRHSDYRTGSAGGDRHSDYKTGCAGAGAGQITYNDKSNPGEPAGTLEARAIIIASGATPRELGVPGEATLRGWGVSYCAACDGPFFKNKKIFVVGGGDTACDEALFLSRLSPPVDGKPNVILVHRRGELRASAACANRVLNNPAIEIRFNTKVSEIKGKQKVETIFLENPDGSISWESADAVFIFAGLKPSIDIEISGANLERDESGFIETNEKLETSIEGIFAAGDIRAGVFRQVITAAGDGAIAAHSATEYLNEK